MRHDKDSHTTVGIFPTEQEAMKAGYRSYEIEAGEDEDGWQYKWQRKHDDELHLSAMNDVGGKNPETFTVTIKRFQQQRERTVQRGEVPRPPPVPQARDRCVYLVREDQRSYESGDRFEDCDLQEVTIHGVFDSLVDANLRAQRIYKDYLDGSDDAHLLDIAHGKELVSATVADPDEEAAYRISVQRQPVS